MLAVKELGHVGLYCTRVHYLPTFHASNPITEN